MTTIVLSIAGALIFSGGFLCGANVLANTFKDRAMKALDKMKETDACPKTAETLLKAMFR